MKTKTIRQVVKFEASAKDVYDCLMDSKKHSAFTQSECKIGKNTGDSFSAYDGYIEGTTIELIPGEKVVQSWHASDWPKGHYSEVIFEFEQKGSKTKLKFTHSNVPEEFFEEIKAGWIEHYWSKMKEFFAR
ncbi:MAG TPA: SRPBCC family protein [archaeon]|nr:SRPBCC family protein [archaeon]